MGFGFFGSLTICGGGDTGNNGGVAVSVSGGRITGFTATATNGGRFSTASVANLAGPSGTGGVGVSGRAIVGLDVSIESGGNVTYVVSGGAEVVASPLPMPVF